MIKLTSIAKLSLSALGVKNRIINHYCAQIEEETIGKLARIAAGPIKVRVDEFGRFFLLKPQSDLFGRLVRRGYYEPDIAQLVKRHLDPFKDFIDIGANVGFYTVFAAKALPERRVLAVEPVTTDLLEKNIELNTCAETVILFHGAVSSQEGETTINIVVGKEEYSSLGRLVHPSIRDKRSAETKTVETRTIDSLVLEHKITPGLMKIDIEGGEVNALHGAAGTIMEHRPTIICEVNADMLAANGSSLAEFWETFATLNYSVLSVEQGLEPITAPGELAGNVLAIPDDH